MHVISRRRLREFARRHPKSAAPLDHWYHVASRAEWRSLRDVRRVFPGTDGGIEVASGRKVSVFNVPGNVYRLVTDIHYNRGRVYILMVMTHAAYSSGQWKRGL